MLYDYQDLIMVKKYLYLKKENVCPTIEKSNFQCEIKFEFSYISGKMRGSFKDLSKDPRIDCGVKG